MRLTDSTLMRRGASNKHAISLPPAELTTTPPPEQLRACFSKGLSLFELFLCDVAIKIANVIPALARLYMLEVIMDLKIIPLTSSPCVFPV